VAVLREATVPEETPRADRVRAHTRPERLARLDQELRDRVARHLGASDEVLSRQIAEVERESDMERVLATNASVLALAGLVAGLVVDRRFLAVPVVVLGFLLQHARHGWCPPVPVFRRLGVRTRQEIDAEKYALRALRGDFDGLREADDRVGAALDAARR
jgi:hypothetical protein